MPGRIDKLWQYLRYFIMAKKIWRWPRQSAVLIFDSASQNVLLEYLEPWKPEVLHVGGERINMPVLLASLLKSGKFSDAYVDSFIEKVRPRLVITFIDNSFSFYSIRQRHPTVKTLFVQNGSRSYYADIFEVLDKISSDCRAALRVDYMLTFGPIIGAEYARHIKGTVVSMGSIRNNRLPRTRPSQRDVIAFVSQWHKYGFYVGSTLCTQETFFGQADRLIIRFLMHYAKQKQKRLTILRRNRKHDELCNQEEAYFRKLLGCEAEFLDPNGICPSYQAIDTAEVVVAVDTTLGYESIARGNRTAIFSIRSDLLGVPDATYGWPGDFPAKGPFWTNHPNAADFERILDHLFAINDEQWQAELAKHSFEKIMIYDPGNSILKSVLQEELGSLPAPLH